MDQTPELVPLADDCVRTELGMNTDRNAAHIRELLKNDMYEVVVDSFDFNWVVEGGQSNCFSG